MTIQIRNIQLENQQQSYSRSGLTRTAERQETAPRLTELVKKDLIEVVGKRTDSISKCKVAIYKRKGKDNDKNIKDV